LTNKTQFNSDRPSHGRRQRSKSPRSGLERYRDLTPTSLGTASENIPWKCKQLVIGTGAYGKLPAMNGVKREARHRHIDLLVVSTAEAIEQLNRDSRDTNAILHVKCSEPDFRAPCPARRNAYHHVSLVHFHGSACEVSARLSQVLGVRGIATSRRTWPGKTRGLRPMPAQLPRQPP
jgi:hypothetical protein